MLHTPDMQLYQMITISDSFIKAAPWDDINFRF